MAANPREGVYEVPGFAGLRNTVAPEAFEPGDLVTAENIDIDDGQRARRRKGFTRIEAATYSSIFAHGDQCVALRDSVLVRLNSDETTTSLVTGMLARPVSYFGMGARIYWSNGPQQGVVEDGANRSWGIDLPFSQGSATQQGGALRAGTYKWAVVFRRVDGQLSGTGRSGAIELTEDAGILLSAMPVSADPDVSEKELYISDCDGDTLFRRARIVNSDTAFTYHAYLPAFEPLRTQFLVGPPGGDVIAEFNGHALVAQGNTLYYSESYAPELFDPRKNYRFESAVRLLAPVEGGVYLGLEDHIYFLAGEDPAKWVLKSRAPYGVIAGTLTYAPTEYLGADGAGEVAVFASTQGVCVGANDGAFSNLTQERFLYPIQSRGAAVVRKHRGINQFLVVMQGAETAAPTAD